MPGSNFPRPLFLSVVGLLALLPLAAWGALPRGNLSPVQVGESGADGPDLTVPTLSALPDEVCQGEFFSLAFALANAGTQDAGAHQVFLFNDAEASGFTHQTFTGDIGSLLAGQTRYFGLSASSVLTGTRYLKAIVDGGEVISETDETNNSAVIALTVQPDPAPTGSLLINGGTASTPLPHLTLTLSATDTGNCATSVAEMRFTYDSLTTPWEPYTTTKEIIVNGTGEVQVAVQFRDEHRNPSPWIEATILIGEGLSVYLPLIAR